MSLSSLNTTTTSASSTSTFFSPNSTSMYTINANSKSTAHHHHDTNATNRRLLKQQQLLEKAANLSSSPINLLQSIAAKALNFKLKNSLNHKNMMTDLKTERGSDDDDNLNSTSTMKLSKSSSIVKNFNSIWKCPEHI